MSRAFSALPRPTGPGVTLLCVALTRDQRSVIDRAAKEVARQSSIVGVDSGSPAAVGEALTIALSEWLTARGRK